MSTETPGDRGSLHYHRIQKRPETVRPSGDLAWATLLDMALNLYVEAVVKCPTPCQDCGEPGMRHTLDCTTWWKYRQLEGAVTAAKR